MENANKEYNKYDSEIEDVDEIQGTDIKINPDFYIHKALLKAQDALSKDNLKEGFIQYRQMIEYIEVLCKAADIITDDYYTELKYFENSQEYKESDNLVKSVKIAHKKLNLMMSQVFKAKTATFKLKG